MWIIYMTFAACILFLMEYLKCQLFPTFNIAKTQN